MYITAKIARNLVMESIVMEYLDPGIRAACNDGLHWAEEDWSELEGKIPLNSLYKKEKLILDTLDNKGFAASLHPGRRVLILWATDEELQKYPKLLDMMEKDGENNWNENLKEIMKRHGRLKDEEDAS